ncbi:MAG: hypothetical protein HYV33_03920 [Candidatus Kerfeldbacteria bacterium]|nr:hypothetical protein [Candidatus Kerfeldbacteria bacterium]
MQRQCVQCSKTFRIEDQDLEFYEKISVPPPTLCPDCRQQRRLAWRNERNLYERTCSLCHQTIISMYRPDTPYTIYCQPCWWSDRWESTDYAQAYNPQGSFFEQFSELQRQVPRVALANNNSENSPYCNFGDGNKNCYLVTSCNYNEDCFYGFWMVNNSDCGDLAYAMDNRMCYELVDCNNCNQVRYSQDCRDCNEAWLLYDCAGCSNCFGCTNLRMKQYYIFNKPYAPDAYTKLVQQYTQDRAHFNEALKQFSDLKKKSIQKYTKGTNNSNVTGGGIRNSHNAKYCFEVVEVVDSAYVFDGLRAKDCYDLAFFDETELCYECHSVIGYNMQFSTMCRTSPDTQYSDSCHNCKNVFGCVGLRNKQFHILNKAYSKSAYQKLRASIINDMTIAGEYGEFFPVNYSFFSYNETLAQDFYPLTKKHAAVFGWNWFDALTKVITEPISVVPDDIRLVSDDVVQAVFTCKQCQRRFKIIPQELSLYRRLGVQLPQYCFVCRQQQREQLRNPWKLFRRQCMCTQTSHGHQGRCVTEFETNYAPSSTAIIYCEHCYQKEIF